MNQDGSTVFLSKGNTIHRLICVDGGVPKSETRDLTEELWVTASACNVPQQKIFGNRVAAFGQGSRKATLFLSAASEDLRLCRKTFCKALNQDLHVEREKDSAPSSEQLAKTTYNCFPLRGWTDLGYTNSWCTKQHAAVASILRGSGLGKLAPDSPRHRQRQIQLHRTAGRSEPTERSSSEGLVTGWCTCI